MVHPSRRFAGVSFYPSDTTVTTNNSSYAMTSQNTGGAADFQEVDVYYFMGEMTDVYAAYKAARGEQGYAGTAPQSILFEIGWESWDQLRWNANGETVRESLEGYLSRDYPIRWAVIGSGFWEANQTTTSFGFIDESPGEYPNTTGIPGPAGVGFGTWTEQNNIAWLIGQRTSFITPRTGVVDGFVEGPFTQEADQLGYFVNNLDGTKFENPTSWFPGTPAWVLDGSNPAAATWYAQKFELWKRLGIDGVKEDTGATINLKRTDVFNGPMRALSDSGSLVMGRNGVFTMPGSLHRINDTQLTDLTGRTPINWLQYAASAAPNAYADSIGIFQMGNSAVREGVIRNAWVQSLTAGMAFSAAPWDHGWSQTDQDALHKSVEFRHALTPYIYSAAVDSYQTGYPHTMTPLYIAYPDDPNTYDLANTSTKQFEWMVGPSLLAAPLMTNINGSSDQIDIYLPPGKWIDYHTGVQYNGGQTLTGFVMENDRPPVFVGGKGILVERSLDELTLSGAIYPVSPPGTSYTFTHADGASETTVLADHLVWSPSTMRLTDLSNGLDVSFVIDQLTGALRFDLLPNRDYQLTSLPSAQTDRQSENGDVDDRKPIRCAD
jgi:alpha-glucosidase (family GH31 glycosyl hydrolase)